MTDTAFNHTNELNTVKQLSVRHTLRYITIVLYRGNCLQYLPSKKNGHEKLDIINKHGLLYGCRSSAAKRHNAYR